MDEHLGKPLREEHLEQVLNKCRQGEPFGQTLDTAIEPKCADPVDLARLRKLTNADDETIRHVMAIYLSEAEELSSRLDAAIGKNDLTEVRNVAHKWAGSSSTCGIEKVTMLLRQIENQGRQGKLEDASIIFSQLMSEHNLSADYIRRQCGL
jgi:HPt (histidine-containing phosphotransfer) domain-containing protein